MSSSRIWARFEARVEEEDPRVYHLAAHELLSRLMELRDAEAEAELERCLRLESRRILESLYMLLIELTGGPQGRAPRSPIEQRLLQMRALTGARMSELRPPEEQLSERDIAAVQGCLRADESVARAVAAIASGQVVGGPEEALRDALADYRAALSGCELSPAGARLLGWKLANALSWSGRAAAAKHEYERAEQLFGEAAQQYSAVGDQAAAAQSQAKAFESLQAGVPDTDERLRRLDAELDGHRPGTLPHAQALVAMAALAADHGDLYAAGEEVERIRVELREMGFPAPEDGIADAALIGWIDAIPGADPPEPNRFLGAFAAVLQVQAELARMRLACVPEESARWQPVLDLIARIAIEMPQHTAAVDRRLRERMAGLPVPAWARGGADAIDPGRAGEYLEIMAEINLLIATFDDPPDDATTRAQLLARAERLVARARVYGEAVPLSQALWVQAALLDADGRHHDAVAALLQARRLVSVLGDATEREAAITVLGALCKVYTVLGELDQVSRTAGEAIEAIEHDRYRINAPFLQSAFLSAYRDVFTLGVFSALELADYDTMLARTELSKARSSVRRLFARHEHPPSREASAEMDGELRRLSTAIQQWRDGSADDLAGLRERRQRLWDLRAIGGRDPAAVSPAIGVRAVQAVLDRDEALLYHYWLRPTVLVVVTLAADAIEVEKRGLSADQRALLERFIDELGRLHGSNLSLDAQFIAPLAGVLLPDKGRRLLRGKRRLAISPHRLLHWFPFHAAPWEGAPLVRSFAVRYVPNLTSLLIEPAPAREPFVLALAVSRFPGREARLGPLSSVAETEAIASGYRARSLAVEVRTEPTREQLLAYLDNGTLARATCLHLATHGASASAETPMDSTLELADTAVDGLEISAWPLGGCEVTSLGACDAGQLAVRGRGMDELPGDEMFGLPAAFADAGARCVLAPAWPVDDEFTAAIMVAFHRRLAEGVAADLALQAAQCEFLDAAPALRRRAYYWSPLFLLALGTPAGENTATRNQHEDS